MTAPRFLLAGLLLGFAAGALHCGPVGTLPGRTSLLIRVVPAAGFSKNVYAYVFSGERDGLEAFATTQRPEVLDASLSGPQTFRVVFPDGAALQSIRVEVVALDEKGASVGFGEGEARLSLGQDVEVEVRVEPPLVIDAGQPPRDAGFDAGQIVSCACDGGCCGPDGGCFAPVPFSYGKYNMAFAPCGQNGYTCDRLCNPAEANLCINNGCSCGGQAPCGPGEVCQIFDGGAARCICDEGTGCLGCCSANRCLPGEANNACGRTGLPCANCADGGSAVDRICTRSIAGVQYGVCGARTCASGTCASGLDCWPSAWPRCRFPTGANACYFCDPLRSSRCEPSANDGSGCACGINKYQCPQSHYCDRPTDGGTVLCRLL